MDPTMSVVVVWLERASSGTAASAHLRGTLARLNAAEAKIEGVIANTTSPSGREGALRKIRRIAGINLRAVIAARRRRTLIARSHPLLAPAVMWWRVLGGKVVLLVQGSLDDVAGGNYPWLAKSRVYRQAARLAPRLAHGLIAGAPVLETHIRAEMLSKRASYANLPNGVFVQEVAAARTSSPPASFPYVVFVGALAPWQGVDTMAAATVEPTWPAELRLVIVGDGPERGAIPPDNTRIVAVGALPSTEAHRWLAHAYAALSLKKSDNTVGRHGYWPFKLIESAAAGVPIVVSDAPGMSGAAAQLGNALVVPAQSSAAAANAVATLWHDKSLRNELAARGVECVQRYDWVAGAEELRDFIAGVRDDERQRSVRKFIKTARVTDA